MWLDEVLGALDELDAPVDVFFRDDDAGWGDARLRELLDRFAAAGLPVDLAVIPAALTPALAEELAARPCGLHQHGYAHVNHQPEGRKCEFGAARGRERQRRDIEAGRRRLGELLGTRVDPIFTPPWNRCTRDTAEALAALGFAALSRESRAAPFGLPGLAELPVMLDWVRLEPGEIARRLAAAIRAAGGPVGVMLHHAVMDAGQMSRMSELLALLGTHDRVLTKPMRDLVC
jgi:peptidoglycan/xylan/chitin deacetylase (PgdA/CDA1 family)